MKRYFITYSVFHINGIDTAFSIMDNTISAAPRGAVLKLFKTKRQAERQIEKFFQKSYKYTIHEIEI